MKRLAILLVVLLALLVVVAPAAAQEEPPVEDTGEVVVEEPVEDVAEGDVEAGDVIDEPVVEEPVEEESGVIADLVGLAKEFLGENGLQILFVVATVYLLRTVGFVAEGNQTKLAVIFAAMAAAGLGAAGDAYPEAAPWLDAIERIYVLVVSSPLAHRLVQGAKDAVQNRVNTGGLADLIS